MYYHLIGIKEKDWKQYQIDCLITGGDIDFLRGFLAAWWVVIISLLEYKEAPEKFGRVFLIFAYNQKEIKIISTWDDLRERLYFFMFLNLSVKFINFFDKPIPEYQMQDLIKEVLIWIKKTNEEIAQEKAAAIEKETKKYEETWLKEWLKVINTNIDRINQILRAGQGILPFWDIKQLEEVSDELKKIRLWTNFNKMATLVFDAQNQIGKAEEIIFKSLDSQKFIIADNSYINNIDVLVECHNISKASDKATFMPNAMSATESVYKATWSLLTFLKFLWFDISHTFKDSTTNDIFTVTMNLVEYFILTSIVFFTFLWTISGILGQDNFSLYYLPAFWRLGLLVYLYNNLQFSKIWKRFLVLIVLIVIYMIWLKLLLNTFAL